MSKVDGDRLFMRLAVRALIVCAAMSRTMLVTAQSIPLSGVVTIQNSAYETGKKIHVSGASIRAPYAKPTSTDKDGVFTLHFSGLPAGSPVRITMEKPGLVVVDRTELDDAVLGGPAIEVVMAPTEELEGATQRYHKLIMAHVQASFEQRYAVLERADRDVEERIAGTIREETAQLDEMEQIIQRLTDDRDKALLRSGELAARLARVDLDRATVLQREAYEALSKGDVAGSLAMLDTMKMGDEEAKARTLRSQGVDLVARADSAIRGVFRCHGLKADLLFASLDYAASMDQYQRMVRIIQEHGEAFSAGQEAELYEEIAAMQQLLGSYGPALDAVERVVRLRERAFGRRSLQFARALVQQADILLEARGIEYARTRLALADSVLTALPEEDPRVRAAWLNDMAVIASREARHQEALDFYERSLEMRVAEHGWDHADVVMSLNNLAQVLHNSARYEEAIVRYDTALVISKRIFPPGHPTLATCYLNRASTFIGLEDLERATADFTTARELFEEDLGSDHPYVGIVASNLADVFVQQGDWRSALDQNTTALRIFSLHYPPTHPDLGIIHCNRGAYLLNLGDLDAAYAEDSLALTILTSAYGPDAAQLAGTHLHLGQIARERGRLSAALVSFTKAHVIMRASLGAGHPQLAVMLAEMADAASAEGLFEEAMQHVDSAISIADSGLGPDHGLTLKCRANKCKIMGRAGRLAEGRACAGEVRQAMERKFGLDHPDVGELHVLTGNLALLDGDTLQALRDLDMGYRITRGHLTAWTLHRVELARHNKPAALEWALRSWENGLPDMDEEQRAERSDMIKALARELERKDVLDVFNEQ